VPASPVAAAAPSVSVSADPVNQLTEETAQEVPKERKARFLKWQNIIGDKIYKEQTARGGVKWFVGQKITPEMFVEQGISVDEAGSQMLKTMEKAYGVKIGTTGVTVPTEKKDDDNKPPAGGAVEVIPKPDESQPSSQPAGSAETPADAEPKTTVIPEIPEEIPADIPASYQPAQATAAKDENPLQEGVAVSL